MTRRWVGVSVALALVVACSGDDASDGLASDGAASDDSVRSPSVQVEGEAGPSPVQRLDVIGTEYAFELDPGATLRPGWTTVSFHNEGDEAHQVMFARLKDGVDPAEVSAAAAGDSSGSGVIEYVDMLGGVSYIGPDQSIDAMVDLPTGTVMAICYVPDPDGVAHGLLGMQSALTVDETSPTSPSPPTSPEDEAPQVVGTIELAEDGYVIPDDLPSGWYRVVNTDEGVDGHGLHELAIMRLDRPLDDDEVDEVVAALAGNATPSVGIEALGGLGAISPGFEGYLHLDLGPGDYLAVDFMPDPGDPRPHLLDGYYATFSI